MGNKFDSPTLLKLLFLSQCFVVICKIATAREFDFYYFVQQWPGSLCDSKKSCCYPTTGKPPSYFGIHGLWPNKNDGTYPSDCDPNNHFNQSKILDLVSKLQEDWATLACPSDSSTRFWEHEWGKHGTCSSLNQHSYFKTALDLKSKLNLLQALRSAGINPDDGFYNLSHIKGSISKAVGFDPWIECNTVNDGNSQLYQVYLCVDTSGSNLIECPIFPKGKCGSSNQFPTF